MEVPFGDGSILVLPDRLLSKLRAALAMSGYDFESGGILLGSKEAQSPRFIVKELTSPSSLDTRKKVCIRSLEEQCESGYGARLEGIWRNR